MPRRRAARARLPSASRSARGDHGPLQTGHGPGQVTGEPVGRSRLVAPAVGRFRQVDGVRRDRAAAHQNGRPLDDIAQLPDIARPFIGQQAGCRGPAQALAGGGRKCSASGTMSARRSRSGGRVIGTTFEAVIQVGAEQALGDEGRQVAMRGGHEADIDPARPAAEGRHDAILEHAQDLGLHRRRHVADLVEEQRPAAPPRGRRRRGPRSRPVNAPWTWPNSSLSSRSAGSPRN